MSRKFPLRAKGLVSTKHIPGDSVSANTVPSTALHIMDVICRVHKKNSTSRTRENVQRRSFAAAKRLTVCAWNFGAVE